MEYTSNCPQSEAVVTLAFTLPVYCDLLTYVPVDKVYHSLRTIQSSISYLVRRKAMSRATIQAIHTHAENSIH